MRNIFILLGIAVMLSSCSGVRKVFKHSESVKSVKVENKDVEIKSETLKEDKSIETTVKTEIKIDPPVKKTQGRVVSKSESDLIDSLKKGVVLFKDEVTTVSTKYDSVSNKLETTFDHAGSSTETKTETTIKKDVNEKSSNQETDKSKNEAIIEEKNAVKNTDRKSNSLPLVAIVFVLIAIVVFAVYRYFKR